LAGHLIVNLRKPLKRTFPPLEFFGMKRFLVLLSTVTLLSVPFLPAQDSRTVAEPTLPPICSSLDAQLSVSGHSLAKADEDKLDTARIQQALDACSKGQGVMLRTHGAANAFLSGPLELREGVTLIVDKGTTLFCVPGSGAL
jgi:polygalacturonase